MRGTPQGLLPVGPGWAVGMSKSALLSPLGAEGERSLIQKTGSHCLVTCSCLFIHPWAGRGLEVGELIPEEPTQD